MTTQKLFSKSFLGLPARLLTGIAVASTAFTVAASDASAADQPWEKWGVKAGGLVSIFDSTLTFGNNNTGAEFNAEDELGLDDKLVVFRAEALYRPGKSRRNQIDFAYAGYHRDGDATISRSFTIDGVTYPVGARIESFFDFDIYRLSYTYAFWQTDKVRMAAGLGVYGIPVEYGVNITTGGGRTAVEGADVFVPLPAIAFRVEYQIHPKLFLYGSVDGMYIEANDFIGGLLDSAVGFEYRPWENFALGFGYSGLVARVESETSGSNYPGGDFVGNIRVHYNGLMLYGKLKF